MNTQLVIIRDFMNRASVKVVCDATLNKVFVTSESAFQAMKNGGKRVMSIGFDRGDVFEYSRQCLKNPDWEVMRLWKS